MNIRASCRKLYQNTPSFRAVSNVHFTPSTVNSTEENSIPPHSPGSQWSINAKRLLRAILRECSYLPDPQAREYIAQYAVDRFKAYTFKAWERRSDAKRVALEQRLKDKHAEARKALHRLQLANRGSRDDLLDVLLRTYGRKGKRRNLLLEPWILSDDQEAPSRLPPALYALASSQIRESPPALIRPNPRRLAPDIPPLNSWLKPMPQSRVRNMTDKWYKDLLMRVLPPLPGAEWHKLRDLANGHLKLELPKRRTVLPDDLPRPTALEMVMARGKGIVEKKIFERPRSRELSQRSLQRLYQQVFRQCPLMVWKPEKERWTVIWGSPAVGRHQVEEQSPATDEDKHSQHGAPVD